MASRKRSIISNDSDVSSALYKEWDEVSCPICMDHPHNAVLLICSSHDNGCRSYVCDTSYRHSNCLDRLKKRKEENADSSSPGSIQEGRPDSVGESNVGSNLRCPLCRGSVLGWKVVEDARKHLNLKSRSCSSESCSFFGNYRELRRHARRVHPTVRPADVDPSRQRAWHHLEDQREYNDIVSAIHSAMPGAVVFGDYVIENGDRLAAERDRDRGGGGGGGGRWLSTFFLFHMIGSMDSRGGGDARGGRPRVFPRHRRAGGIFSRRRYIWGENLLGLRNNDDDGGDVPDLNRGNDGPTNPRRRRRLNGGGSSDGGR
ncbi:uncharacterized protein LOC127242991 [Andrographis paniculata]|uniref:uncharacterized protein LOC127242991 n=1 Tax=Andrographis paniculata TaxID=175694 RepID=UPI0021E7B154|nr:uncharacterized protein LOC127242991 [Andrographis paniculata]XP_051118762.1 uncharacterized protein LOC127242991 [Andrographis paniculata]XP_051118763.1 uncharacterized protein LOC127242991 [Andrographis paniculata]XP_051118764.1 uncharacterized protein LOC127242991 [Andrographis paniculata]XP_051118765.1 uncharacterized protein LOC127242991 [Andrographis paniculata]